LGILFKRHKEPEIEALVESLIGQFSINICDEFIVINAAATNNYKIAEESFREGFEPTPGLMAKVCAVARNKKFIELLFMHGADASGDPIVSAVKNPHVQVMRELLKYPTVEVSYNDNEAFKVAFSLKNYEHCVILLGHKGMTLSGIPAYNVVIALLYGYGSKSTITKTARLVKKEGLEADYIPSIYTLEADSTQRRRPEVITIFKKVLKFT
jgi:hypothetical protein